MSTELENQTGTAADSSATAPNKTKNAGKLFLLTIFMFGFGFALVPLYEVFCEITGINGRTDDTAAVYEAVEVDESRTITIDFITRTTAGMPWEFKTETTRVEVHPGELSQVEFYVRNPARRDIVAQAIPSVSPGSAALYVNKTECFCFQHQPLASGAETVMPMQFFIDPQLPENITYFTLQYTLYDITERAGETVDVAMNTTFGD